MPNVNVAPHNPELRAADAKFSFRKSWGYPMEGHSKPEKVLDMNPIYGNRGEWVLLLFTGIVFLRGKFGAPVDQDPWKQRIVATNRYAPVEGVDCGPLRWTL